MRMNASIWKISIQRYRWKIFPIHIYNNCGHKFTPELLFYDDETIRGLTQAVEQQEEQMEMDGR
jgi:hypothetical protein